MEEGTRELIEKSILASRSETHDHLDLFFSSFGYFGDEEEDATGTGEEEEATGTDEDAGGDL